MKLKIGILTISDRASQGIYEDISGLAIREVLSAYITSDWDLEYIIIPDEQAEIEKTLILLADEKKCHLIVTTGGTGPALRDLTPEATEKVCHKILPGFGELMRNESLKYVPTAILSRQTAGIRNESLIINLPGKPSSIKQCLDAVFPAVPYCIELIGGPLFDCNQNTIKVFSPKKD
jgi:molybdopterin adenylyltransferase